MLIVYSIMNPIVICWVFWKYPLHPPTLLCQILSTITLLLLCYVLALIIGHMRICLSDSWHYCWWWWSWQIFMFYWLIQFGCTDKQIYQFICYLEVWEANVCVVFKIYCRLCFPAFLECMYIAATICPVTTLKALETRQLRYL